MNHTLISYKSGLTTSLLQTPPFPRRARCQALRIRAQLPGQLGHCLLTVSLPCVFVE
jgi:hypothetical protein